MALEWDAELLKAVTNLAVALVTIGAGWIVGQRISYKWNLRQKRKELTLTTINQFQAAYGEFFAVWKLWDKLEPNEDDYAVRRWDLLQRSAKVEAMIESTLLKVVTEFHLSLDKAGDLGRLRQAFQSLRESILERTTLGWSFSGEPHYVTFKRLSCDLALLLQTRQPDLPPSPEEATRNHLMVTSNKWERN